MFRLNDKFIKAYKILLSVSLIVVGLLMIILCVDIYASGDAPFSRETVEAALESIIIPIIICTLLVAASFFISIFNLDSDIPQHSIPGEYALSIVTRSYDLSKLDEAAVKLISDERQKRKTLFASSIVLSAFCGVCILSYLVCFAELTVENLNSDVLASLIVVLPCVILLFTFFEVAGLALSKSIEKERALILDSVSKMSEKPIKKTTKSSKASTKAVNIVRISLFALALTFIALGVFNGGMDDVLQKAIKICTECIGLG